MFSDETESGDVKTSSQYLSDVPTSAMDGRDHTGTTPPRRSGASTAWAVMEEYGFPRGCEGLSFPGRNRPPRPDRVASAVTAKGRVVATLRSLEEVERWIDADPDNR